MGLLQGPRLMAWTTKSPIRGNHWVPLGCRALLGSVKIIMHYVLNVKPVCCYYAIQGRRKVQTFWGPKNDPTSFKGEDFATIPSKSGGEGFSPIGSDGPGN